MLVDVSVLITIKLTMHINTHVIKGGTDIRTDEIYEFI